MKSKKLMLLGFTLAFLLNFSFLGQETFASSQGYDLNKIQETSENVDINELGIIAKDYSIPILIGCIILSGFLAVVGMVWKPLRVAAGSLFGIGILSFIFINYAPEIGGVIMSIVEGIIGRITGGA